MKIMVLGAGLVGGPAAADLAREQGFEVTTVDADERALNRLAARRPDVELLQRDLGDPLEVERLVRGSDLVLSAVPGSMGFRTLEAVLRAGRSVVDIAFFPEDPFELHELAVARKVTALVDCGIAPGMSNLLVGHVHAVLSETDRVRIYVGGLPQKRSWPFEYRAVFSPADVIEEYTRPARFVQGGRLVTRPALSDPELVDFPGVGTLEAFNTDGLRTLVGTLDVPNMKEKTLRYPGHIEKMSVFRASGFFDREEIQVGSSRIRPLDLTSHLLCDHWKLEESDLDLTVMRVDVFGRQNGRRVRWRYELLDRYCETTRVHSMARTTGYTATMAIRLLAAGHFAEQGVFAPERLGRSWAHVDFMLRGLAERGVRFDRTLESLGCVATAGAVLEAEG